MQGIFWASVNGADSCREYSGPQPMVRTRAGNILGLSQWYGIMQGIFRASANGLAGSVIRTPATCCPRPPPP
eukprot:3690244-Pyramimonas_sp.AAC.1